MKSMTHTFLPLLLLPFVLSAEVTANKSVSPEVSSLASARTAGIVRVNSTVQPYNFFRPWSKRPPVPLQGIGAVVEGNRVLVVASLVANNSYVELEKADDASKTEAVVEFVDYESNLAILRPNDPDFLTGITPMGLSERIKVGDLFSVLQLESAGTLATSPARATGFEMGRYWISDGPFLITRISLPFQYREGSHSFPVVDSSGDLVGLSLRYDTRSQTMDLISLPVIRHFLADIKTPPYEGFPRIGASFSSLRDPVLRKHLGLKEGDSGVFVSGLSKGGPAERAGVKEGDVLLEAFGHPIDADGNFKHEEYGELSLSHIFSTKAYSNDKVPLKLVRNGEPLSLEVTVERQPPETFSIPPYVIDQPPDFVVISGFVFIELSRQYLAEWGGRWEVDAPLSLVYLDRFQNELLVAPNRVVVMTHVLPTPQTIGYEDLKNMRIISMNGKPVNSLKDLVAAKEFPQDGFHIMKSSDVPHSIVLNAGEVQAADEVVRKQYGISTLQRLSE
jgi:S1-C subfamily serine protease